MAYNLNTSQFVKTYGKPRRTQGAGHDSLWYDSLADDFDKCMGIEDSKITTFISPEAIGSISKHQSPKHKKTKNKTKTIGGWSLHLHSILTDNNSNSTKYKRNIEWSFNNCNKKNPLLKSADKKISPTSIKKPNNKFILPREQCSTPLQQGFLYRGKFSNFSSKKKKKTKFKKKLNYDFNVHCSSELPKKLDEYTTFDESTIIAGSCCLQPSNQEINSQKICTLKEMSYNHKTKLSIKRYNKKKKLSNSSKTKSSNWYNKMMNVLCAEDTNEKSKIEEIGTLDKSSESVVIHNDDIIVNDIPIFDGLTNKDEKLPQLNQFDTSSLNNSTCAIQNIVKIIPLNFSHKNIDMSYDFCPNQSKNNKSKSSFVNCNQTLHMPVENISFQSNNIKSTCNIFDSESQILVNIANKLSDITIENKISNDRFSISKKVLNESDKSTLDHSLISNNSSNIHSSSSLEQDTVICNKQNCIDISSKENLDSNNLSLKEKTVESLKIISKCFSKRDSLKCNDLHGYINTSNNQNNVSNQTYTTVHKKNLSNTICHPDIFQFKHNGKTELFNFDDSCVTIQEKFQYNDDETCSLYNQIEDISSIAPFKFDEQTTSGEQTNISNCIIETSNSNMSQNTSRQKRYAGRFENLDSMEKHIYKNNVEVNNPMYSLEDCTHSIVSHQNTQSFRLEPGKKYRRSILIVRNFIEGDLDQTTSFAENTTKGRNWNSTVNDVLRQQFINTTTIHQQLDQTNTSKNSMYRSSERYLPRDSTGLDNEIAKKYIFEACNQQKPISFESWLTPKRTKKWKKVGEGVYGEVFKYTVSKCSTVVKVIPIEGTNYINSERQKMMFEVYSEILIATELNSLLKKNSWNEANSFCKLKNISCVQGKYPKELIELWKQYDNDKGSDNDNPSILPDNQMFMILEMEDGGIDVENYLFNSAYQALFAFLQIVFGLAVAEQQYDFEHRDLHIGNILVKKCATKHITYMLDGQQYTVPSGSIKISIIDFTLSRMTYYNKPIYNNLSDDPELFTSDGDYQFEVYRLMKNEINDQWDLYKPKTNIYWLHYILDKMQNAVHYRKTTTIVHNNGVKHLQNLKNYILSFDSAKNLAESNMVLQLLGQ